MTAAMPPSSGGNAVVGSGTANLSADIMQVLLMMQNYPAAAPSPAATADPLSNMVSAIDTNGDGTISQSELETYLQGVGGTQGQADALFEGLQKNNAGNLTQAQLAADMQNAAPAHGGHHRHHHHQAAASSDKVGLQLVQAMDSNGDSSVDQSEFESFFTALGGTATQADADFAALAPQDGGGVTAGTFSDAVTALEQNAVNGSPSPILTILDDLARTRQSTAAKPA